MWSHHAGYARRLEQVHLDRPDEDEGRGVDGHSPFTGHGGVVVSPSSTGVPY